MSCYGSPVWVSRTTRLKYSRQSRSAVNERLPAPLLFCPEKNHEIQAVFLTLLRCANFIYEQPRAPSVLCTEDTAGANSPRRRFKHICSRPASLAAVSTILKPSMRRSIILTTYLYGLFMTWRSYHGRLRKPNSR